MDKVKANAISFMSPHFCSQLHIVQHVKPLKLYVHVLEELLRVVQHRVSRQKLCILFPRESDEKYVY